MTSPGWCVDATKKEPRRKSSQSGYNEEQCFKLCEDDSSLTACTFVFADGADFCNTYSGDVKNGNLLSGYKCHYYKGK